MAIRWPLDPIDRSSTAASPGRSRMRSNAPVEAVHSFTVPSTAPVAARSDGVYMSTAMTSPRWLADAHKSDWLEAGIAKAATRLIASALAAGDDFGRRPVQRESTW